MLPVSGLAVKAHLDVDEDVARTPVTSGQGCINFAEEVLERVPVHARGCPQSRVQLGARGSGEDDGEGGGGVVGRLVNRREEGPWVLQKGWCQREDQESVLGIRNGAHG